MRYKFFVLIIFFYSFNLTATNIRVIDINFIIENHHDFISLITDIEKDQKHHKNVFNKNEKNLEEQQKKINELSLILDNTELEKEISKYNDDLNNFNLIINNFNAHYEKQIINLKNRILEKILETLKKYSLDNQIELILDSNNYILSTNNINITDIINNNLKEINFDTNFEKYK